MFVRRVVAMLALLAIVSCGKPSPIVGEWKMDDLDNLTMTFRTDGTFQSVDNGKSDTGSYHIVHNGTILEATFEKRSYKHGLAWLDTNTFQTTTATNHGPITMTWRRLPNELSNNNAWSKIL
jgi:hypothetical protein